MCQSSETCLDPSEDDRCLLIYLTDQVAVYNRCVIRTLSHHASRRISIRSAVLFRHGIMIHHRIHISRRNKESQSRFSKNRNAVLIFPVRLRNDTDFKSMRFQKSRNDRMSERRMVYISISGNIDKIQLFPSPFFHILFANR